MTRRDIATFFTVMMVLFVVGCSTNTDLGGSGLPNSRPDTRVTGQPPTLLEAGFAVEFNWTGNDPDGRVVGYQWKISDNGLDGISPRDTVTVDPLTGAEINPWYFTTVTDTTFIVLADQEGFEGDPEGFERSFRTHSLFVRAMDEKGDVDPTPALISFTSTTIVPTCSGSFPGVSPNSVVTVPPTVNFTYTGADQDFELGVPTHVRFLMRDASFINSAGEPDAIGSARAYEDEADLWIDFDDPNWSLWQEYGTADDDRVVSYSGHNHEESYLFAVQVRDTAGATSIGKTYGVEVVNVIISETSFHPTIQLNEYFLGSGSNNATHPIPSGQPLNFSWASSAESYSGNIVAMRHGWDLDDVEDVNDPGWAVPSGMGDQNRFAEERSFAQGAHHFTVKATDDSGFEKILVWTINIVPFVSRESQDPLVFVDQVHDEDSGRWPNSTNSLFYDREEERNAFWSFLEGTSGVYDFTWADDGFDHREGFTYEHLVNYKAVLINARSSNAQLMFSEFRPLPARDQFVWLSPYQKLGGNVFLVGSQSMESFLRVQKYMVPIVFESTLEFYNLDNVNYVVGFGTRETPDGEEIMRGPLMYPFDTVGISALDWNVPLGKNVYGRRLAASIDRSTKCSGLKELRLIDEFRSNHLIGPGAIASTIPTHEGMDWRDPMADAGLDTMLNLEFPFTGDEFVDDMIAERPATVVIQDCEDGYQGKCIEPMFTGVTRFDWIREQMWDMGETDWPGSAYDLVELSEICGAMALNSFLGDDGEIIPSGTARANGKNYGYLSYKTVTDKPGNKADVYWGFDPYRFNHSESKKAVRWVLQHFGLALNSGD